MFETKKTKENFKKFFFIFFKWKSDIETKGSMICQI